MIGVTVIVEARPEAADAMQTFWAGTARRVLAEDPGCRLMHVQRCESQPNRFVVFEIYGSQADLEAHEASALSKELLPELVPLMAGPPQVIKGPIVI